MKRLLSIIVILLTLYGPLELTRVIIDWGGLSGKFIFEICFMWLLYTVAMVIIFKATGQKTVSPGQNIAITK